MANPNLNELFKDRRVVIGASVVGLGLVAGLVFFLVGQNGGGGAGADQAVAPPPPVAAAGPGANPAAPGGGITAPPTAPGGAARTTAAKPGTPPKVASSFDTAPPGFFSGAAAAPGGPTAPTGGGGAVVDTATAKIPLAPIKPNVKAAGFRPDPFESYRYLKPERPGAFNFIAPLRIASRSQPKVKPPTGDPTIDFGPLPFVPRRVAGVLYNGQVSAILETGTPGDANTQVQIIQPGAAVTSGIPGIPDLTVASISPTQVILRAEDGRTVTVPLTAVPAAYESAFRSSVGGAAPGAGAGGPPPGTVGRPGGPGGGIAD